MAKKPRKSMDDPRNWGKRSGGRGEGGADGGGGSRDGREGRRQGGASGQGPGRRDPRSIGAPQQGPVDWGDFEWTPPRETRPPSDLHPQRDGRAPNDLRPPSEAPAPVEVSAPGAWKDFDTMYPEPEQEGPATPTVPSGDWPRSDPTVAAHEEWRWVSPSQERSPTQSSPPQGSTPQGSPRRAYRSYRASGKAGAAGAFGIPEDVGGIADAAGGTRGGAGGTRGGDGGSGGVAGGDVSGARPDSRRFVPAGSILIAMILGLVLAALFNAQSLQRQAESLHVGTMRSLMLALVKPVVAVSSALRLDEPRAAIEDALGRGAQEQTGVHTRTTEPTPSSKPSETPSPGKSGSPKPPDAATQGVFAPTEDRKLALWVGGDSMAMVFGESVVAMGDRTGLIESALDYHVSSGLSRPDFFNWPNRIKAEMKSFQPDVAVFASGANDGQGVEYEGQVLNYGSEEWIDLYHQRVGAAMDLLGDGKRQVWWVGMPIARDPEQSAIYRTLNKVYVEEAKKRPFVHYLDTYKMFSDEDGNYNDYLVGLSGKTELMRQGDGIHWSRAGGDLAAATLLEQIAKLYKFDFEP
jgi:hypothetical protein